MAFKSQSVPHSSRWSVRTTDKNRRREARGFQAKLTRMAAANSAIFAQNNQIGRLPVSSWKRMSGSSETSSMIGQAIMDRDSGFVFGRAMGWFNGTPFGRAVFAESK